LKDREEERMIVHIVMIKFREMEGKEENIAKAAKMIRELEGKIPSLKSIETGINFSGEDRAMDLVLRAVFDDREGLEAYAIHPLHRKVVDFIGKVAGSSKVVDYEAL
jgi:hypothetical protein